MDRGVCPNGHLKHTGKINDRCRYRCPYCIKRCSKKLKSWSSAYMYEPCSCQTKVTKITKVTKSVVLDNNTYGFLLMCQRGHKTYFKQVGDVCHYECYRCGRSCDHIIQYLKYDVIDEPCECYQNKPIKKYLQFELLSNDNNQDINICCTIQ